MKSKIDGHPKALRGVSERGMQCLAVRNNYISRLAHAGNPPNSSSQIRKAVVGDLVKKELKEKLNEPPLEDMWQDWPGISTDG